MKEKLSAFWDNVKSKWGSLAKNIRIFLVTALSIVLVGSIVLTVILNQKDYVVIYNDLSEAESGEIVAAISNMGISDVKLDASGSVSVASDKAEQVIMQLSIDGYPASSFNNDIWDNSIGMFSTDTDKKVKQVQQLQSYLMAAINSIEQVRDSYVIVQIPESANYVVYDNKEKSSASIKLNLKNGKSLTSNQIEGIYNLVLNAVPGLEREKINVSGSDGETLDGSGVNGSAEEDKLYQSRLAFQKQMQDLLVSELDETLKKVYKDYTINVNVLLDYDDSVTDRVTYTPSIDAEGNRGGMVSDEQNSQAWSSNDPQGGPVGTVSNSDISPNYPTTDGETEGLYAYESANTVKYLVNTEKQQIQNNGYDIKKITASVMVDETNMLQADRENLQRNIAFSIGTEVDYVTITAQPFLLDNGKSDTTPVISPANYNWMYMMIVSLGVLVIALLIIAILTGNAKKKKRIRAKAAAAAAGAMPVETHFVAEQADEPEDFNVQSLMDENASETRGTVLKREIGEFSKTNPDIVAQLIRTLLREE